MGDSIEEELKDLPQEWVCLLNSMQDVKEVFIRDKKLFRNDMISPCFFSYFEDDYKKCEPFFLCFERGKEVFDNFYELYGEDESSEPEDKDITENELKELLARYIYGLNYLLEMEGEAIYNIHEMDIQESNEEDLEDNYDIEEDTDIGNCCYQSMNHNILSKVENPINEFEEALYDLTMDYNLILYILWPLGKVDDVENPYKAYVELWKRGIRPYIINKNLLVVVR